MSKKIKPAGKFMIILLIMGGLFSLYMFTGLKDKLAGMGGSKKVTSNKLSDDVKKLVKDGTPLIKVGVVTWGGYAAGQYYNEGFKANTESRFYKDQGMLVDFVVLDDFESSRNAFKSGDVDMLWVTADAFCTETGALKEYDPKFIFQADWSRGGDAIVATRDIKSLNDLKGKKVAVALGTPSHTFLLMCLESSGINPKDINIIEQKSAVDAAVAFKAGAVDAAVVWSPDDEDCISNINGSKILTSTKSAGNIIADGFFVKGEYLNNNKELLTKFVTGWMIGAEEINNNNSSKEKAIQVLVDGLNLTPEVARKSINNVRLVNLADNKNFFGVNSDYKGVTGEMLYNKMSKLYKNVGLVNDTPPQWRNVCSTSIISSLNDNSKPEVQTYSATSEKDLTSTGASTKHITVTFPSGSYELTEDAKYVIDSEFGDAARMFNSKIRIEGNTDNVGNYGANKSLSKMRAKSVANYLVDKYGLDRNKFVIVGNGSDKPVADNDTDDGKSRNRRTDFIILN